MSILNKMKKVKKEMVDVPEHHLAGMEFDVKFIYLVGLTMAMWVDEQIKDLEKQQLEYQVKAMLMPETTFEKLLELGRDINEEQVKQLVNTLKDYNLEYSFIMDTAIMMNSDNECQAEEREFQQIIVEMLGIPKAQQDFLFTFASALGQNNIDKLFELMGNTCGIDKEFLNPYLQNIGLMVNVLVSNEIKVIKGKTLELRGDFIVEKGANLVFDTCQLRFVGCNLTSGGKLEIKNCMVSLDANSQLQLKDIDFSNSSFNPAENAASEDNDYQITGVAFNISEAETVTISNCNFHGFKHEHVIAFTNIKKKILIDKSSFIKNRGCVNVFGTSGAFEISTSIFEDNEQALFFGDRTEAWVLQLFESKYIQVQAKVKACQFKNIDDIAIINVYSNDLFIMLDCTFVNCEPNETLMEIGKNCSYL